MAVTITNVNVAGGATRLLGGDSSRVALIFFTNQAIGCQVGPVETLTLDGAMFALPLQKPLRIKLREFGETLGREWWSIGAGVGTINCIEVLE